MAVSAASSKFPAVVDGIRPPRPVLRLFLLGWTDCLRNCLCPMYICRHSSLSVALSGLEILFRRIYLIDKPHPLFSSPESGKNCAPYTRDFTVLKTKSITSKVMQYWWAVMQSAVHHE